MSLLSELKRRNVFKVGGAYLVAAWVIIQVADTVAPQLGLPEWAPRFVTLLVLLGAPLALVLAWIFDVTPEGIRPDARSTGNKRVIAAGLIMAATVIVWYWRPWNTQAGAATDARSIAVLPFVNMSGDPDQEYFSDGISEEILNVLARTPELRVAARTSSFAFKDQDLEVPEIARALQVGMVLEGSVRQQGERVRITAQLIDADTGFHLWSETYDRNLEDIFAVQDEIARAIGEELQVRVGGAKPVGPDAPTEVNPAAYDLYLRGLALWQARSVQGLFDAIDAFERAAEIAPDFTKAYRGLALVYSVIADYTPRISHEEAFARGRDAAERALALDPDQPEAFAALGGIAAADGRKETALALLQRAVALSPSFATAHQWLGTLLMTVGHPEDALAELERASTLDSQSAVMADNHADMLLSLGRYTEAVDRCAEPLARGGNGSLCRGADLLGRLYESGPEDARPGLEAWAAEIGGGLEWQAEALVAALEGRGDGRALARHLVALPLLSSSDAESGVLFANFELPSLLVLLGENELALQVLERGATAPYGQPEWGMMPPMVDPIRCDPRFVAAADALHFVDFRRAEVCG